jgi:ribosome-associated protein
MPRSLIVSDESVIPESEFALSFARSAGPGGQNVNKVNSKALLRWNVAATEALPEAAKSRFLQRFAPRISQAGDLLVTSDRYRDQPRNVADCYDKLRHLILTVLTPPRRRVKTRPSRASVERRLQQKRSGAQKKAQRRYRPDREN